MFRWKELNTTLGFICSFSSYFKCKIMVFIEIFFSELSVVSLCGYKFPLRTALAGSQILYLVYVCPIDFETSCFPFHLSSGVFFFFFFNFLRFLSVVHCLVPCLTMCFVVFLFSCCWFHPHSVVARKDADINFCFLKFAKVCFVVQRVENVYTWKQCVFKYSSSIQCILLLSIEYSINVNSIVLLFIIQKHGDTGSPK